MNEDHEKRKRLLGDVLHDEGYRTWREGLRRELNVTIQERSRAEERLLREVIHDEDYLDFRESLRSRCLEELPVPRLAPWMVRTALLAAGAVAAFLLVWLFPNSPRKSPAPANQPGYIVHSRRLSSHREVAGRTAGTVRSRAHKLFGETKRPSEALAEDAGYVVHTGDSILTIRTNDLESEVESLSDKELLAMFHPRPCAIVKIGSTPPRVHFFDTDDTDLSLHDGD